MQKDLSSSFQFLCKLNFLRIMQSQQNKLTSDGLKIQAQSAPNKDNLQVIHQNPNINVLKKMFVPPKTYNYHTENEQSLLFNKNHSISIIKAYRQKKKNIEESFRNRQNEFSKKSYNLSTIDSPQKINFCVQSVKYQFNQSQKRKDYYNQILKMIVQSEYLQTVKSTKIQEYNDVNTKRNYESLKGQKLLIKSLSLEDEKNVRENKEKNHEIFYSPKKEQRKIIRIFRQNGVKSSHQQFNRMPQIGQNRKNMKTDSPSKISQDKSDNLNKTQRQTKNYQMKKQNQSTAQNLSLPEIKVPKSMKKIKNQTSSNRKGYMAFHPEAKSFIKQNRQKLNQEAKIKSVLISGITASSFVVIDLQSMTPITYKNFHERIEIASISKVMTCYLCILACKKYGIDDKNFIVRISRQASQMNGTSAGLQLGDCLTLQQSLYALMLPSGNDASYAIAESIGKIIQRHKTKQTKKSYYQTFITHMNILSRELKLQQQWKNSSGLPQNPNHSTPSAICLLTIAAMMDQKFRNIVSCKQYEVNMKNERTGLKKTIKWKNTNKLLNEGWQGVKTGTTQTAGHCLMAKKDQYLIAVFDSSTLSKRFTQCSELYNFVKSKQRYLFPEKWD